MQPQGSHPGQPNLSGLATFVRVVRHGSLAAAARALGVPKSTVSRRLQRLESELEVQLIHRGTRRFTLTVEGNRLFDSVAASIDHVEAALHSTSESAELPRGHIRITAPGDFGRILLLEELNNFANTWPEITFEIDLTNRIVDLISEGYDLAIRAFSGPTMPGPSNLIRRRFIKTRLHLTMGAGAAPIASLEELASRPFVLFRQPTLRQTLELEDAEGSKHRVDVAGRFVVHDFSSMVELVCAGAGVGLIPQLHLKHHKDRLIRVLPQYRVDAEHISLVYPSRRLPRRVSLLIDHLTRSLHRFE